MRRKMWPLIMICSLGGYDDNLAVEGVHLLKESILVEGVVGQKKKTISVVKIIGVIIQTPSESVYHEPPSHRVALRTFVVVGANPRLKFQLEFSRLIQQQDRKSVV